MRKLMLLAALAVLPLMTGCIAVSTPAIGVLYTDVAWTSEVTSNSEVASKSETGKINSFFGLFAYGDASVDSLARRAGIVTITHIDTHTQNVLGFGTLTVTVHGN